MSMKEIAVITWLILMINTALGMYSSARIKKTILEFDPEAGKSRGINKIFYDENLKISFRLFLFVFKSEWKSYPKKVWLRFYLQRFLWANQIILMLALLLMIFVFKVQ